MLARGESPMRITALCFPGRPAVCKVGGAPRIGVNPLCPIAGPTHRLVLYCLHTENGFCVFKWLKRIRARIIICDVKTM